MASRLNVFSGAHWEQQVGYARAVRMGDRIEVAGTTATDKETILHPGDAYGQTRVI
ncbi:MAG: RidA family protein, partial [Bacteroidetes bacterium]